VIELKPDIMPRPYGHLLIIPDPIIPGTLPGTPRPGALPWAKTAAEISAADNRAPAMARPSSPTFRMLTINVSLWQGTLTSKRTFSAPVLAERNSYLACRAMRQMARSQRVFRR
jgi:hypothetical protein